MDKINGDLKSIPPAIALSNTKNVDTKKRYLATRRNNNVSSVKKLKQREVKEVDYQFCKLSVTRSESYKQALDLLIATLKQKSAEVHDETKLRRIAHTILQLHLPKKQNKAKQALAEILANKEILETIADNHKKGCIELAYEYLLKDKIIPESYLQSEIYQHLADEWFADSNDSNDDKLAMIRQHAESVDIKTAKDFTFKRFLRLKKCLVEYYGTPVSYKDISTKPQKGAIELEAPLPTKYYLDDLDKSFINKQITDNRYLKIKKYDLMNRVKRSLLHNKRVIAEMALARVVVGLIGSAFTFGASFIFSIFVGVLWTLFLKAITVIYQYKKNIQHNNEIQQRKLLTDDINTLTVENKKDLKKFITSCSYVCRYDSIANLMGCFSELEKSADKLKQLQSKQNIDVSHGIKYEQQKIIYQRRKQDLHQHLADFVNLTADIVNTAKPNILELKSNLDTLWDSKFQHLSTIKQQSIFLKALNKKSMASYKDKLLANNKLTTEIFPFLKHHKDREVIAKTAMDEISRLSDEETTDDKEIIIDRLSDFSQEAKSVFKGISLSFIKARLKMPFFFLIRGAVYLKNQIPVFIAELKDPIVFGIDWLLIIGFTALGITVESINSRMNQRKIDKHKKNEKLTTGILITRDQTLREELYLLKKDTLKNLENMPKQMNDFFERCDELNQQMLSYANIDDMDDEKAAELFIQYLCLKQELEENLLQAFGEFYQNILTKTTSIEESLFKQDICEF